MTLLSGTRRRASLRRMTARLVQALRRRPPLNMLFNRLIIDDFYPVRAVPRYGHDRPVHAGLLARLREGLPEYEQTLVSFRQFLPQLRDIPLHPDARRPAFPAWNNGFFPGLDTIGLFGLISTCQPRMVLEVGSGHSTKVAAFARRLNSPGTQIISLDPQPRAEIDGLCDRVIREPLETADLAIFQTLAAGDVVFLDGSHRVFQNSDTAVFFMDILPLLPKGVLIHFHDIVWPDDYPLDWGRRYYSEQYMLAMLLLYAADQFHIVLPNHFLARHTQVTMCFDELWRLPQLQGIERHGVSFWLRRR